MLVDLLWDEIPEDIIYELRGLGERYNDDQTYHTILIGDKNSGKRSFINSLNGVETRHLPTKLKGVRLSLLQLGKDLIHIWAIEADPEILAKLETHVHITDGVIGLFDLTNEESYLNMQARVSELITYYKKMYPLIILGNKADLPDPDLKKEDILIFAYELGNCSCHRIPYNEISARSNIGLDQIYTNLISMINCNQKSRCSQHPSILRQWCNIPQYYSFVKEPRQKLEVV